jgi:segregation and condensation protein A
MTPATIDYAVDLEVFQGPMDLLLYLIRKDEIDIYDIPIAKITAQYMKYVEMLKLLNLENAGEYILMAATLIRIKAQMLLPHDPGDEDELDPREELTRALLEYRKYKEAAEILEEKRDFEGRLTPVSFPVDGHSRSDLVLAGTTLYDLLTAFQNVVSRIPDQNDYFIAHEDITVEDRVKVILAILGEQEFATFEDLFADVRLKIIAIVTFMAILEMVRLHRITVRQAAPFSEIRVYRTARLLIADPDEPVGAEAAETSTDITIEP